MTNLCNAFVEGYYGQKRFFDTIDSITATTSGAMFPHRPDLHNQFLSLFPDFPTEQDYPLTYAIGNITYSLLHLPRAFSRDYFALASGMYIMILQEQNTIREQQLLREHYHPK